MFESLAFSGNGCLGTDNLSASRRLPATKTDAPAPKNGVEKLYEFHYSQL